MTAVLILNCKILFYMLYCIKELFKRLVVHPYVASLLCMKLRILSNTSRFFIADSRFVFNDFGHKNAKELCQVTFEVKIHVLLYLPIFGHIFELDADSYVQKIAATALFINYIILYCCIDASSSKVKSYVAVTE